MFKLLLLRLHFFKLTDNTNRKQLDNYGSQLVQQHDVLNQPSCSYHASHDEQFTSTLPGSQSVVRSNRLHQEASGLKRCLFYLYAIVFFVFCFSLGYLKRKTNRDLLKSFNNMYTIVHKFLNAIKRLIFLQVLFYHITKVLLMNYVLLNSFTKNNFK